MSLWNRKHEREVVAHDKASSVEVTALTRKSHATAEKANRDIQKLNRLLRADGITLKIHVASGGRHG